MSTVKLISWLWLFITLSLSSVIANKIDSLQLYAYYNAKMHNTVKYEVVKPNAESDLVVRRGSNVFLAAVLTEPFNNQVSQLYLRVMFGPNPSEQDGSMFFLPVQEGQGSNNGSWSAHSAAAKDNKVDFKLYISPQAAVGAYRLTFMVIENGQIASEVPVPVSVYILFNPWSNSDSVFMQDKSDIDEYVMNNFGVIYIGTVYNPEARQWYYDQFKKSAIQTAVYLLDFLNLSMQQRADPIIVSRSLSQMSNSNDDNGVVFGKWTEPYEPEGKAPWNWMSSGEVLDNYVQQQGAPVKFGQCWVFAGITTTLSRTLGIPARTTTCFAAAHDTDNNLVIDRFFDIYGNEIKGVNADSVWNFHVWTEVWMARPDLKGRFTNRNWQVIDGTPQEKSDKIMRMGPANIAATKIGDVNYPYDMPFLYSEVNADQISWVKDPQTQRFRKVNVVTNSIGQLILTKRKGQYEFQPLDVTLNYKFREGSQEERDSIFNAARIMGIKYVYDPSVALRKSKGDVNFEFKTENKQKIGENLIINYVLTNKATTKRTVDFSLNLKSTYYTGKDGEVLKKITDKIVLGPKESRNFTVVVTPEEYLKKKVEFNQYKAIAFLRVEEKDVDFVDETIIALTKPELKIKVTDNTSVGQPVITNVSFKNPYRDQPLTNCKLISKETAISDKVEKDIDDIPAGGNMNIDLSSKAKKEGGGIILVSLDCKELHDVRGHKIFNVNA